MKLHSLLAAIVIVSGVPVGSLIAGVPNLINYQGKLYQASGAPVPDGAYKIALSIYDVPTGGTAIWTETQNPVVVKGSAFHALLGSVNPIGATIFSGPDRYLGVKLGDDPELSPRQRIASVPFSMVAEKSKMAENAANAATAQIALSANLAESVPDRSLSSVSMKKEPWMDWQPIFTGGGQMTVSNVRLAYAKYYQVGSLVHYKFDVKLSCSGAGDAGIVFTLPVNAKIYPHNVEIRTGVGLANPWGWLMVGSAIISPTTGVIHIYNHSVWNTSVADTIIGVSGHYEAE